ncbi:hypothetical protein ECZU03_36540 [Escherichia coli]|nr:hypothetical protein ECZU03_36540 [Escherichia coli]
MVTRAAAGDTVTVTLGGNTYTTTVQSNLLERHRSGSRSPALGNGDLTITASVTNANGNTGSGTRDITIDANLPGCAWIRWRAMILSTALNTGRRW